MNEVALQCLVTHDALRATHNCEPALDDEGMPRNPEEWIAWRETINAPAYSAWADAMTELDAALGAKVSRHPFNFRPLCEALVNE